jgi:hypothetical protein
VSEVNRDSCDFCRTVPTFRGYSCENFSLNGVPIFSQPSGMWMACEICAELVNAGEWSALAERAYQSFAQKHGVAPHEANAVRAQFYDLVAQFAAHWKIEN